MKEENPNSCRVLSTSRKDPIVSSFISINISQPKIRIKIPKLLGKAMQRRPQNHKPHDTDNTNDSKNKKKWAKPRNLFPKKVYSMVQNVFGNRNNDAKNQTEEDGKAKSLSFSGIFNKRNGLGFKIKGKSNSSGRKIQRARTMRERGEEEEREERGGKELCKKRILMGEKCRPLNLSGALHYDQNGVLLPEEVHDQLFVNP